MPRSGSGIYTLDPRYLVAEGETIIPAQHNPVLEDIATDLNTPRPIVAGGTGASTAVTARTNLDVYSKADTDNGFTKKVATRTALKALDTATNKAVVLTEAGRIKLFAWTLGDFTEAVAGDPNELSYIPADGVAVSIGCWVAATGSGSSIIPIVQGGTGATDTATALANLGAQPQSANLDAWSALATSAKQDADANLTTLSSGTTTLGTTGLSLLGDETAADGRATLGLGTAATLNSGDASGNLKALNADGGFSFATSATPSVDIDGAFGGTWKTSHRFHTDGIGTANLGTYATASVSRLADGLAADGATNSDLGLFLDVQHSDYLTSTAGGQVLGTYTVIRGNRTGDHAGHLVDIRKVFDGTYNGSALGIEVSLQRVNASGTVTGRTQSYVGWTMSGTGGTNYAADDTLGFCVEPRVGNTFAAYAAVERSDLTDAPAFTHVLAASTSRNYSDTYFLITGTSHSSGAGKVHAADGTISAPAHSFKNDPDTGIFRNGSNGLGFAAGGSNVGGISGSGAYIGSGLAFPGAGILRVQNSIQIGTTKVIGAQGAAVADATDAASVITQLNALLARLRTHGLIAT